MANIVNTDEIVFESSLIRVNIKLPPQAYHLDTLPCPPYHALANSVQTDQTVQSGVVLSGFILFPQA